MKQTDEHTDEMQHFIAPLQVYFGHYTVSQKKTSKIIFVITTLNFHQI